MTREELLEKICPTNATAECLRVDSKYHCSDCEKELNNYLDKYDKRIRTDVIDEFVSKIEDAWLYGEIMGCVPYSIKKIARGLKEQL